jgi:hypothetical protein
MTWAEQLAKLVAGASFTACLSALKEQKPISGPLHVRVYGCMLQLTCFSGAAATLVYSEETTAALWALRCLTDEIDGVLGAIQSGNLTRWEASFWESTLPMPGQKDIENAMRRAARRWNQHGKSLSPRTARRKPIGAPPEQLPTSREEM